MLTLSMKYRKLVTKQLIN